MISSKHNASGNNTNYSNNNNNCNNNNNNNNNNNSNSKNLSFISTSANLHKEKDKDKDKEKDKDNAQEREIDELADLQEKFKHILLRSSSEDGEDCLIYGMKAILLTDKNKIKQGIIYCNDETFLQFLNPKSTKNQVVFKLSLRSISDMSLGKTDSNLMGIGLPLPDDCCLSLHYSTNLKHYNIIFKDSNQLELFITGVISTLQKKAKEGNNYDTDLLSLKRIWKEYDPEHNKYLNLEQFSNFLKNIKIDYKNKNYEQIFKEIDKKNEGKIRFKDFISFYELLVTGEEFKEVFQKYACPPFKAFLTIKGLVDFMEKEQHETLSQEEALKLVCKYSKKAKKLENKGIDGLKYIQGKMRKINLNALENTESMLNDYENYSFGKGNMLTSEQNGDIPLEDVEKVMKNAFQLSFREFVNLIIDQQNNIYDQSQMTIHQNMNLPLTEYFCHSSHNTYLTGNQITSESSIEMYSYVLKNGCRFVDLDTFDGREGDKNEPIITHWHFPVGDISFKEVLISIKDKAFIKNEFPVILSLENHCSEEAQERMERYFLEILGRENIFIIDPVNPPLIYPSPNELKRKFIIKNKRKRIFGNLTEMKINYHKLFASIMANKKKANESNDSNISKLSTQQTSSSSHKESEINKAEVNIPQEKKASNINEDASNEQSEDKKAKIINRITAKEVIIEECQSNKSMDSDIDEGNVEFNSSKIFNEDEGKYRLMTTIPSYIPPDKEKLHYKMKEEDNNISIIPSNHFEIEYCNDIEITKQPATTKKKGTKKNLTNPDAVAAKLPTFSQNSLKKLKQKYIIDDSLYALSGETIDDDYSKKTEIMQKIQEIQINDEYNKHQVHIITVDRLAKILGMVGVKYHKETFDPTKFLPWECISISESDILKYITSFESKCKIIKYCQKSFLKIYPDGFRTNSSNHNPILCWSLGCQFAALNLQTTNDDWVLINKIFFKINGGSKCGYVLKPSSLREFNMENYRKSTLKPCFKVKLKILSGFHLHLCCPPKDKITGMFIEASIKSPSNVIEKENKELNENKLVTNLISNNFLHPVWQSNSVVFDIYDPELTFILVKLYSKKKEHILARGIIPVKAMSFGYRVLELYDNLCSKCDESYLIVRTNKILL